MFIHRERGGRDRERNTQRRREGVGERVRREERLVHLALVYMRALDIAETRQARSVIMVHMPWRGKEDNE